MIKTLAIIAVAGATIAANGQDVIAHYGFDNSSLAATSGSGSNISVVGTFAFFGGTTLGLPGSGSPPAAPSVQSGSNAIAIQGTSGGSLTFNVNTTDYIDVAISFAAQRTDTGGANTTVSYSYDGVSFTNIGVVVPGSTALSGFAGAGAAATHFFSLSNAGLDDVGSLFVRLSVPGATSAGGNQRFDNIVVQGTLIPTPASAALLAFGGLVAARRRRA